MLSYPISSCPAGTPSSSHTPPARLRHSYFHCPKGIHTLPAPQTFPFRLPCGLALQLPRGPSHSNFLMGPHALTAPWVVTHTPTAPWALTLPLPRWHSHYNCPVGTHITTAPWALTLPLPLWALTLQLPRRHSHYNCPVGTHLQLPHGHSHYLCPVGTLSNCPVAPLAHSDSRVGTHTLIAS